MEKKLFYILIVVVYCLPLSVFGQGEKSNDKKNEVFSKDSVPGRVRLINKYRMASSEIDDMHCNYKDPNPFGKYCWKYYYSEMKRIAPEESIAFAGVTYDLIYIWRDNTRNNRGEIRPGFLIKLYLFSTKSKYIEARDYFGSRTLNNGLSKHTRKYLTDSFAKWDRKDDLSSVQKSFYDSFYSDNDKIIIEIAMPSFQDRFSVVWDNYIQRTGVKSVSKLYKERASGPISCVQITMKAAKENDFRAMRNNYVSLSFYELCYRNKALRIRPNASEKDIEFAIHVVCMGHRYYVKGICAFIQEHEGKLTFEDLGKGYIGRDMSYALKKIVGDDYSNVLVMEEGKPVLCAIVIKNSGGWKVFEPLDVPKELKDILKNL